MTHEKQRCPVNGCTLPHDSFGDHALSAGRRYKAAMGQALGVVPAVPEKQPTLPFSFDERLPLADGQFIRLNVLTDLAALDERDSAWLQGILSSWADLRATIVPVRGRVGEQKEAHT